MNYLCGQDENWFITVLLFLKFQCIFEIPVFKVFLISEGNSTEKIILMLEVQHC